jgi:hypothetical protein
VFRSEKIKKKKKKKQLIFPFPSIFSFRTLFDPIGQKRTKILGNYQIICNVLSNFQLKQYLSKLQENYNVIFCIFFRKKNYVIFDVEGLQYSCLRGTSVVIHAIMQRHCLI